MAKDDPRSNQNEEDIKGLADEDADVDADAEELEDLEEADDEEDLEA